MTSSVNAASAGTGAGTTAAAQKTTDATSALAQKDTFLKLLVAQIRNQDPLKPTDGIQFVSQLAQFSELEQLMSIRSDLEGLGAKLAPAPADAASETTKENQNV